VSLRDDIRARVEAIEESYEFFLAYAAQGVSGAQAAKSGGQLRTFLDRTVDALEDLGGCIREVLKGPGIEPIDAWADFADVIGHDARAARAAVRLVAAQPSVSSQMVDNLNGNVHLRALLMDLYLLEDLLG